MLTVLKTALEVGLIYGLVALALFISFSILNIADLSTDGCFTLGCAVGAMLTIAGHPLLALPAAMAAGMLSGFITAFLQTRLGVESILAGIISNTGLYTINLAVMGFSSNVSITGRDTVFSLFKALTGGSQWSTLVLLALLLGVIAVVLIRFFGFPSARRATVSTWSAPPPSTPRSPSRSACASPTLSRRSPAA
jgi:putative ABC transport system permease protein